MIAYAGSHMNNPYSQYREQSAMTASPGELTLMLYEGCIKDLKLSKIYIAEKNFIKANEMSQKAQAIIDELIRTLDMHYSLSTQLLKLYDFILTTIIESNMKKDAEKIDQALELLAELRDTWQQAVKLNRRQVLGMGNQI